MKKQKYNKIVEYKLKEYINPKVNNLFEAILIPFLLPILLIVLLLFYPLWLYSFIKSKKVYWVKTK